MSRYAPTREEFEQEALSSHYAAEAEERWIAEMNWLDRFMYEARKIGKDLKKLMGESHEPF